MKIAIGSDHAGYPLKKEVLKYLKELGHEVEDMGTNSTESVDYPVFAKKVAVAVSGGSVDRGIVICGTGIGISIAANRFKGVRASLCLYPEMAELTRRHNNANVLGLGGRLVASDLALRIVDAFLTTDFEGGKHKRRVDLIDEQVD